MSNINFDLNLTKAFVCVYETGSISKASEKLFVSQPAITQSIKRLEEILDTELFLRTPKGMKPTTNGEVLYDSFKKALNDIEQGINLLAEMNDFAHGEIRIGSGSTIMRGLMLPFIFEFRKKYPNIKISIIDGISTEQINNLKRGDIDIALMAEPVPVFEDFDKITITKIEDCFVVNSEFEKNFVPKNELKNYQMILQKLPSSNRVFFDKLCSENKVKITPSLETESFGIILDFISNTKDMIGFSTKTFIKNDLKTKNIKVLDTDFEIYPRDVCALKMKDRGTSNSTKLFLTELESYFSKK